MMCFGQMNSGLRLEIYGPYCLQHKQSHTVEHTRYCFLSRQLHLKHTTLKTKQTAELIQFAEENNSVKKAHKP